MTNEQIQRLKVITIYKSIPSFESDHQTDLELSQRGYIELNKHGARITKSGVDKINELNVLKV